MRFTCKLIQFDKQEQIRIAKINNREYQSYQEFDVNDSKQWLKPSSKDQSMSKYKARRFYEKIGYKKYERIILNKSWLKWENPN